MHSKEYFYDNYRNHPEHVLKRIVSEHQKLTPRAQEALRQVLKERNLDELLVLVEEKPAVKQNLSHLSPVEVRAMINARLDKGEKLEIIKLDLQDRGVNIFDLSLKETEHEEKIEERFIQLQREGKSKAEIDAILKKEFNLPGKDVSKIPDKMYSNGSWFIVVGAVLLMIGLPMGAVALQHNLGGNALQIPGILVVAGLVVLITGIKKRMNAQKFIRESEG